MLANYFFESLSQEFSLGQDLEIRSQSTEYEWDLGSNFQFESTNESLLVNETELEVSQSLRSQTTRFGGLSATGMSQEIEYSTGGFNVVEETDSWQWDGGEFSSSLTQREVSVSMENEPAALVAEQTSQNVILPPEMNFLSQTIELSNGLGSFTINRETASMNGNPVIASQEVEWELDSPLLGMRMQRSSAVSQIPSPQAGIASETQLDSPWLQTTLETSFSLELPNRTGGNLGSMIGGLEVRRTDTAMQFGPAQLTLQSSETGVFASFAGTSLSAQTSSQSWLGQTQTGSDLSLVIA